MESRKLDSARYFLRLDKGEEIVETLTAFAESKDISFGKLEGIGAAEEVEIAFLDPGTKEYVRKVFPGSLEILSLSGNIALKEGRPFLHLHGTFGDEDHRVHGGHFFRGVISFTGEFFVDRIDGELRRTRNEGLGIWETRP